MMTMHTSPSVFGLGQTDNLAFAERFDCTLVLSMQKRFLGTRMAGAVLQDDS